jgi:hypothetical protein
VCCSGQYVQLQEPGRLVEAPVEAGESQRLACTPLQFMGGRELHAVVGTQSEGICQAISSSRAWSMASLLIGSSRWRRSIAAMASAQVILQTAIASASWLAWCIRSEPGSSIRSLIRALVSQNRITRSIPVLEHDGADRLALARQLHRWREDGLLTAPADQPGLDGLLQ